MTGNLRRRDLFRKLVPGTATAEPEVFAHIQTAHCLAYRGPECGACADLCPEGVHALRLLAGRPVLDARQCTGCGACVHACPTSPRALELVRWTD